MNDQKRPPDKYLKQVTMILGSSESSLSHSEATEFLDEAIDGLTYLDDQHVSRAFGDIRHGLATMTGLNRRSSLDHTGINIHQVLSAIKDEDFYSVLTLLTEKILNPLRYVGREETHKKQIEEINHLFVYLGIQVLDSGKVVSAVKPHTHKEAKALADKLRVELRGRSVHDEVLQYCNEDLMQMDYFGAIFEATKGVSERLRKISGFTEDGRTLVFKMFSANKNVPPKYSINNLSTKEEEEAHFAFQNLLSGVIGMFRNPLAHTTKKSMALTETDALDALTIISYVHKMVDNVREVPQE